MYICGKNNNHLIKNNYKNAYSLPQKVRVIQKQVIKCACGHDYIIILTKDQRTYCYFQSAIYDINITQNQKIVDIATYQNLILFVTQKGQLLGTEFLGEKLATDCLKPKRINLKFTFPGLKTKVIKQVTMTNQNIFLKLQNNLIFYLKQNDWTQTSSFSDPEIILASKNYNITRIACNNKGNFFLTEEGFLLQSINRQFPTNVKKVQMKQRLKQICSNSHQLLAITQKGYIIKINCEGKEDVIERVSKIYTQFADIIMGEQNYYAITSEQQAWVWGKNAYGDLGLSDYEPRYSLYPLISLQKYYITRIFAGQNYFCSLIDQTRCRQSEKASSRSQIKNYVRQIQNYNFKKNSDGNKHNDFFNQTQNLQKLIGQTEDQVKHEQNGNKNCKTRGYGVNLSLSKADNPRNKAPHGILRPNTSHRMRQSQKHISPSRKNSVVSSNKASQLCHSKNGKKSISCCSSKVTPKSVIKQKQLFSKEKEVQKEKEVLPQQKANKIFIQSSTNTQDSQDVYNSSVKNKERQIAQKAHKNQYQRLLKQTQVKQMKILQIIRDKNETSEHLQRRINSLQVQLNNKTQENRALLRLLAQKNLIIQDITGKIQLLEQAIEEHQKILTERDNQTQEAYLRQRQYQLHISKLQNQVQNMLGVLNDNQKSKDLEAYKRQMQKLSSQMKEKVDSEKQYYRERVKSTQKRFQQQNNLYQLQIRTLRDEVKLLYKNQAEFIHQIDLLKVSNMPHSPYINNSSYSIESPTFNNLQVKNGIHKSLHQAQQRQISESSQVTLKNIQNESTALQERKENYLSPLSKQKGQIKGKRNSRVNNNLYEQGQTQKQNHQGQVQDILTRIQKNKSYISHSANKLINILQNDKTQK